MVSKSYLLAAVCGIVLLMVAGCAEAPPPNNPEPPKGASKGAMQSISPGGAPAPAKPETAPAPKTE